MSFIKYLIFVIAITLLCVGEGKTAFTGLAKFVNVNNKFGDTIHKLIAREKFNKNFVHSPITYFLPLSLLMYTSNPHSVKEMCPHLCSNVKSGLQYKQLISLITSKHLANISLANKIYLGNDIQIKKNFTASLKSAFNYSFETLDKDLTKAIESINKWVDQETKHIIPYILEKDGIDEETKLIILNVLYFKAKWAQPFSKSDTRMRPFFTSINNSTKVPTMYTEGTYTYGYVSKLNALYIEIPYQDSDLTMVIVVPWKVNDLSRLQNRLQNYKFDKNDFTSEEIELNLPKFKIESSIKLKPLLKKIGINQLFNKTIIKFTEEPLKVDDIFQKTSITVDEEGTEAAAVNIALMSSRSIKPVVEINKPFYFEVRLSQLVLFKGHVTNPLN